MYLTATANNNKPLSFAHDPGIVFRLGSGAGRRPTTTSRTILNYYAWLLPWLIISAQLCWATAAADFLSPATADDLVIRHAGHGNTQAAPPTAAAPFNLSLIHISEPTRLV